MIGKSDPEKTVFFYYYYPFSNTQLDIEFECAIAGNSWDIRDEFCAISEYFLVVHYVNLFL